MTRCIPFSVICFLSQSGITSDGYCRGYVSFAHFCYIFASAYCGSLWLCALRMFVEAAKLLGHKEDEDRFTEVLNKAKESYEIKLWNGMLASAIIRQMKYFPHLKLHTLQKLAHSVVKN